MAGPVSFVPANSLKRVCAAKSLHCRRTNPGWERPFASMQFCFHLPLDPQANSGLYARHRFGAIAQLVERLHGMQEVSGSIPLSSTNRSLEIEWRESAVFRAAVAVHMCGMPTWGRFALRCGAWLGRSLCRECRICG
jgi:hypothetical protein